MDAHIPQGDYYLYGDDTYTSDNEYNHDQLFIHLQNKYTNYRKILTRYGDPYIVIDFPDQHVEFETDYTGYWKVSDMHPRINIKNKYSDKELIKFIDELYEGEKDYAR